MTIEHTKDGRVVLVMGPSRSGKSHFVKHRLAPIAPKIVWDTKPDDYHLAWPAAQRYEFLAAFLEDVAEHGKWAEVVLDCPDEELRPFLSWVYETGDMLVVLEEVDQYCTSSDGPLELMNVLRRGRSKGIHTVLTTQRPAEVPKTLTNRVDDLVLFRCPEPRDREYIAKRFGKGVDEQQLALPRFQYLRHSP